MSASGTTAMDVRDLCLLSRRYGGHSTWARIYAAGIVGYWCAWVLAASAPGCERGGGEG